MKQILSSSAIGLVMAFSVQAQQAQTDEPIFASSQSEAARAGDGVMKLHASDLIGYPVHLRGEGADDPVATAYASVPDDWERAGEIRDVILDRDGRIKSVVLDVGGFLGMGERQIDTRMDKLAFARDSDDAGMFFIVYTGDQRMLERERDHDSAALAARGELSFSEAAVAERRAEDAMTALERGSAEARNTFSDATVEIVDEARTEVSRMAAGVESRSVEIVERAEAEDEGRAADGAMLDTEVRPVLDGAASGAITARDLDGLPVHDATGKKVGDVSEILVTENGQIERAVIDLGGFMGMGEKPVALPFDALLFDEQDGETPSAVNLGFSRDELDRMDAWKG